MECPMCPQELHDVSVIIHLMSPLLLKANMRGMANGWVLLFNSLCLDE